MNVKLAAGKYVVAVSGGVDSMVLLDLLRRQPGLDLVVAHVNHGIRTDSGQDEALVRGYCASHNIFMVCKRLQLKPNASEDEARQARYSFLQHSRTKYKA